MVTLFLYFIPSFCFIGALRLQYQHAMRLMLPLLAYFLESTVAAQPAS